MPWGVCSSDPADINIGSKKLEREKGRAVTVGADEYTPRHLPFIRESIRGPEIAKYRA
jgi:hypothetical protein